MSIRAVLYARFSTDQQREQSIDDQNRVCQRVAEQAGFRIVGRFEDCGISGGTSIRAGYQAMLTAARAGQFDIIVAEDLSRLWRSRAEFGPRSAELEDLGIHFISPTGDDTRRDGWGLVLGIKSAIAEAQRREISYRTRRGMEGLALAGKSTGGRCYGYHNGKIESGEARTVRSIFEGRAAGLSYGQLAATFGKTRSSIQAILANRRYTGAVIWGFRESYGGARDSRLKKRRTRSDGPIVTRQDEAQRIISDKLFFACKPSPAVAV